MASIHYFKALADETRLRLMHILYRHELNVNELVTVMDMGQSRISRHLKILSEAGLLSSRRDGLWVFYKATESGPDKAFLDAMLPFISKDSALQADMAVAALMIEERSQKTQQFFNAIAEYWDKLSHDVLGDFNLPKAILGLMPAKNSSGTTACDLGCGTGNVLEAMLEVAHTVIGVDGSTRMLEVAKARFRNQESRVSLRIGDLAHLPLRDGEADFATLNLVMHHLVSPLDVLQEAHRILRPAGSLIISDFNRHSNERMRTDYGDRWLGFSEEDLRLFLQRAGFTIADHRLVPIEQGLQLHIVKANRSAV